MDAGVAYAGEATQRSEVRADEHWHLYAGEENQLCRQASLEIRDIERMENVVEFVFSLFEVIFLNILEICFEERQRKRRRQSIEKYVAR